MYIVFVPFTQPTYLTVDEVNSFFHLRHQITQFINLQHILKHTVMLLIPSSSRSLFPEYYHTYSSDYE